MPAPTACLTNTAWPRERVLFLLAGTATLLSAALSAAVSPLFLLMTAAVGLNQPAPGPAGAPPRQWSTGCSTNDPPDPPVRALRRTRPSARRHPRHGRGRTPAPQPPPAPRPAGGHPPSPSQRKDARPRGQDPARARRELRTGRASGGCRAGSRTSRPGGRRAAEARARRKVRRSGSARAWARGRPQVVGAFVGPASATGRNKGGSDPTEAVVDDRDGHGEQAAADQRAAPARPVHAPSVARRRDCRR